MSKLEWQNRDAFELCILYDKIYHLFYDLKMYFRDIYYVNVLIYV